MIRSSVQKTKNSIIKLRDARINKLTTSQVVGYRLITKLHFLLAHTVYLPAKYNTAIKKIMQSLRQQFRSSLVRTDKVALEYVN